MERHLAARVVSRQERGPGGGLPDSAGREQAPPLGQAFREEEDSLTALPRRLIQAAEDVHGRESRGSGSPRRRFLFDGFFGAQFFLE